MVEFARQTEVWVKIKEISSSFSLAFLLSAMCLCVISACQRGFVYFGQKEAGKENDDVEPVTSVENKSALLTDEGRDPSHTTTHKLTKSV